MFIGSPGRSRSGAQEHNAPQQGDCGILACMLHPELEDAWHDFRRSRLRKGRSEHTLTIYRKSFDDFCGWAASEDVPPDPGAITYHHVNAWVDSMLERPATI